MKLFVPALLAIGVFLPPGTLSAGLRSDLITFFGLLSAGMMPAMTLLLTANVPETQSVKQAQALVEESRQLLSGLMRSLAYTLGGGVLVLVSSAWTPVLDVDTPYNQLTEIIKTGPDRLFQAAIFTLFVLCLDRLRIVVAAFETVRKLNGQISLGKARENLSKLPSDEDVRSMFRKRPEHGKVVTLAKHDD